MSGERPLKGVCAGAGYFSHFQYEAWGHIPEVRIVAVCNRSVQKAREIAGRHAIPRVYTYSDFDEMLDAEAPDFVDVITAPSTHIELCRAAAERGIHIICQKPLAPTYEETLELARIVRQGPGRFMVHENWRWQPWYREAKRLLAAGVLGEFFHFCMLTRLGDGWGANAYLDRQPFFRDYPRLFIFETGVHFLDTFRFLFGEPESIYATTARRNPVIRGEDSAVLVCRFPRGGTAILDANRYNESTVRDPRFTFGTFRLEGEKGHVELDGEGRLFIKRLGESKREHDYPFDRKTWAGDCVGSLQRHFVDCLLENRPFESTIDDYLKSVSLVEAAYASAAQNEVISFPAK